jgi:hypothetical protein
MVAIWQSAHTNFPKIYLGKNHNRDNFLVATLSLSAKISRKSGKSVFFKVFKQENMYKAVGMRVKLPICVIIT